MRAEKDLSAVEQREVTFYGDEVTAVRAQDGTVYVPVKPLCDLMGVSWNGQRERIQRDPILSEVAMSARVTRVDIAASSRRPRSSEMLALPLDYLNGWLFGINANRVKKKIRDKVLQYQKDCYRVLYEAFQQDVVTARPDPIIDELLRSSDPSAEAYRMLIAMANIAREQVVLKHELGTLRSEIDSHETRLQLLEAELSNDARLINESQAVELSQAVKAVALMLGAQTGRNEFGGVYGEIYRRMEITSYKRLPSAKFKEAMQFLREWWQALNESDAVPF